MARRSVPEKVRLLVNFLLGVRHIEVHRALVPYGWSTEKVDRGWRLLERVGRARFSDEELSAERFDAELLAFKTRWFSIVRIALERRRPEMIKRLIGGPRLSTESSAALLVGPFLEVLDEWERSSDAVERETRELLRARGLTEAVVDAARELVARCREVIATEPSFSFLEAEAEAERELWDFYGEWAAIARRVIGSRSLLRWLGLYKPGPAPGAVAPEDVPVRVLRGAGSPDVAPRALALPPGEKVLVLSAPKKTRASKKRSKTTQRGSGSGRDGF